MFQKISILAFFSLLLFSSCYTMSHPDPCPGLVDMECVDQKELSVSAY